VYDSGMIDETAIRARYEAIKDQLDERGRRLFVAAEKIAAGYGGTAAVSRATGVAHSTIIRGAKDLLTAPAVTERVRREGAGRPALSQSNPAVLEDLRRLVEPATMGDPMRPLLWVSKSLEKLASALRTLNHAVSANTVGKMLGTLGYSRQVNRKTKEGSRHPDRDGQFQHINRQVMALQAAGQPVISVDTKKKELIGEYKNGGSDYRAEGCPDAVNVHDFVDKTLGKVAPMASMTWQRIPAGSVLASTTTQRSLRSMQFAAGIRWSVRFAIQRQTKCSSPPMAVARTGHGCGCGSCNCRNWPMKPG
jgi:Rhodopirellula transposase DDE domain